MADKAGTSKEVAERAAAGRAAAGKANAQALHFFPHAELRQGQDALVRDLETAFSNRQVLIAHAPTGLGKTASALAVAVQHALEKNKKIFFLTNRHTQHLIVIETIRLIEQKTGERIPCADLIGKRWMCSQEVAGLYGNEFSEFCRAVVEKGECEFYNNVHDNVHGGKGLQVAAKRLLEELRQRGALHSQEILAISKGQRMCSYEIALALARKAKVLVGDYYYLFNPHVQKAVLEKLGVAIENIILIVDEGHNLPGRITEMQSSILSTIMLRNALQEAQKHHYGELAGWMQKINGIMQSLAAASGREGAMIGRENVREGRWVGSRENGLEGGSKNLPGRDMRGKERKVGREEFSCQLEQAAGTKIPEIISQLQLAAEEVRGRQRKSYLGGIAAFLESWNGPEEGFARFLSERERAQERLLTISYSCLDPSIAAKEIFSQIHAGVVMSGTLKPMFMYKDLLGIERGVEKEYASPFPPENRLSLVVPVTTTKYAARGEAMYKIIAQHCSELSLLVPGNVALFFPSYHLRDAVGKFVVSAKKLFWERADWSKEEKETFLNGFKAAGNGLANAAAPGGGLLLGVAGANFAEGIDLPGNLLNGVVVVGLPLAMPDLKTRELISYYEHKFGRGWEYGYVYPAMNKCLQSAGRCIRSETDKGAIIFLDERFAWQQYFCCLPREGLKVSREYESMLKDFFGKD